MTLYEIDSQIKGIIDRLYDEMDENGEVGEVDFSALESLNDERQNKLENIALYVKNLEAEAGAIKAEEENLSRRRKRLENKAKGLKFLLIRSITENGDKEISTARCSAKVRESIATEIMDINLIPKEFISEKVDISADKMAIKKALKSGEEVAGARLVVNKTIRIE